MACRTKFSFARLYRSEIQKWKNFSQESQITSIKAVKTFPTLYYDCLTPVYWPSLWRRKSVARGKPPTIYKIVWRLKSSSSIWNRTPFVGTSPNPPKFKFGRIDCHADPTISPASVQIHLLALESGSSASDDSLHASTSLRLVRQTLWSPADSLRAGAV